MSYKEFSVSSREITAQDGCTLLHRPMSLLGEGPHPLPTPGSHSALLPQEPSGKLFHDCTMLTQTQDPTRWGVGPLGTTLWSPSGICVWCKKGKCWLKALSDFFLLYSFPSHEETWSQEMAKQVTRASGAGTVLFPAIEEGVDRICGSYREWWQKGHWARSVFSQCQSVDQLLGGGMGSVTLFYFSFFLFS